MNSIYFDVQHGDVLFARVSVSVQKDPSRNRSDRVCVITSGTAGLYTFTPLTFVQRWMLASCCAACNAFSSLEETCGVCEAHRPQNEARRMTNIQ